MDMTDYFLMLFFLILDNKSDTRMTKTCCFFFAYLTPEEVHFTICLLYCISWSGPKHGGLYSLCLSWKIGLGAEVGWSEQCLQQELHAWHNMSLCPRQTWKPIWLCCPTCAAILPQPMPKKSQFLFEYMMVKIKEEKVHLSLPRANFKWEQIDTGIPLIRRLHK